MHLKSYTTYFLTTDMSRYDVIPKWQILPFTLITKLNILQNLKYHLNFKMLLSCLKISFSNISLISFMKDLNKLDLVIQSIKIMQKLSFLKFFWCSLKNRGPVSKLIYTCILKDFRALSPGTKHHTIKFWSLNFSRTIIVTWYQIYLQNLVSIVRNCIWGYQVLETKIVIHFYLFLLLT